MSNKFLGLSLIGEGNILWLDADYPIDEQLFMDCVEPFDVTPRQGQELLDKFKAFQKDIEHILEM